MALCSLTAGLYYADMSKTERTAAAETAAVVKNAVILNKGGGSAPVKAKRKVLKKPKIGEKVIQIEGMHCDHCKQSVTSELNKIDGVAAKVKLKKNGVDPVSGSTPFF